jgi:hypothetical protein
VVVVYKLWPRVGARGGYAVALAPFSRSSCQSLTDAEGASHDLMPPISLAAVVPAWTRVNAKKRAHKLLRYGAGGHRGRYLAREGSLLGLGQGVQLCSRRRVVVGAAAGAVVDQQLRDG